MTGLPTLTVRQPWASLIAAGVKTIETRSWSTKHRGRIGIHAGAFTPSEGEEYGTGWWWCRHADLGGEIVEQATIRSFAAPLGSLVATAELVDVVPISTAYGKGWTAPCLRWPEGHHLAGYPSRTITDPELSLGDFTPGRFAWLLTDIKPTTERCPWCWGDGVGAVCPSSEGDRGCDGSGHCPPIPAKGKQGLWRWLA